MHEHRPLIWDCFGDTVYVCCLGDCAVEAVRADLREILSKSALAERWLRKRHVVVVDKALRRIFGAADGATIFDDDAPSVIRSEWIELPQGYGCRFSFDSESWSFMTQWRPRMPPSDDDAIADAVERALRKFEEAVT